MLYHWYANSFECFTCYMYILTFESLTLKTSFQNTLLGKEKTIPYNNYPKYLV